VFILFYLSKNNETINVPKREGFRVEELREKEGVLLR
jgi:hypothetical protein